MFLRAFVLMGQSWGVTSAQVDAVNIRSARHQVRGGRQSQVLVDRAFLGDGGMVLRQENVVWGVDPL